MIESWTPSSELEKEAVQQQLERLLASPLFHSSKRYAQFLRFVVGRTFEGRGHDLKERILGIEVFDRPPDYDTNIDPIVRVTAAEIRKRLEQYYQDPKHGQEIRLFLPSGSYAPHFSWPGYPNGLAVPTSPPANGSAVTPHPAVESETAKSVPHRWSSTNALILALGLLVLISAAGIWWRGSRPTMLREFWAPFVKSPEPALFCIADQVQYANIRLRDAGDPQKEITLPDTMVTVIIDDLNPLVNIAGTLRSYGKNYRVLGESTTNLTDLRRNPSIFIGAFDNSWTLRLTSALRFHFVNDPSMSKLWIEDREQPEKREWLLDRSVQKTEDYKDYAIVARFIPPDTDQYAVVVAGIGRGGTVAAGEFVVDERRMQEILAHAPQDWQTKNIEIVLETQVIQGRSGAPRVRAIHVW
ncbi:MAG: hypothetical protein ABSF97_05910 [Candidatus Sulfotelmatobacter sp.]|nr:hypothetical protein [Terriglobales bacterium]